MHTPLPIRVTVEELGGVYEVSFAVDSDALLEFARRNVKDSPVVLADGAIEVSIRRIDVPVELLCPAQRRRLERGERRVVQQIAETAEVDEVY